MDIAQLMIVSAVSTLDIGLGLAVFQRDERSKAHQLFALSAAMIAAWIVLNFISDQPDFYSSTILFNRLTVAAGVLGGVALMAFAVTFPKARVKLSLPLIVGATPLIAISIATLTTTLIVRNVTVESWGTNVVVGPLYIALVVWEVVCLAGVAVLAVRNFREADLRQRVQYRYLYLGLGAFLVTAIMITGVLPLITGNNQLSHFTPLATLLFLIPTAYAMMKHRLLDVSAVVLRSGTYTLVVAFLGAAAVAGADISSDRLSVLLGLDSRFIIFVAALTVLLAFAPLRRVVARTSDNFLYRRTYDPDHVTGAVERAAVSTLELDPLTQGIARVLSDEMKLVWAALAFRRAGAFDIASSGNVVAEAELRVLIDALPSDTTTLVDDLEPGEPLALSMTAAHVRLAAPVALDGELLGMILIGPPQSGSLFTERDMLVVQQAAVQSALALRNAQAYDSNAQRLRELAMLESLETTIRASGRLAPVLDSALAGLCSAMESRAGAILLLDGADRTLGVVASVGTMSAVKPDSRIRVGDGIVGWVAASRKALVTMDDDGNGGTSAPNARPMLLAPILCGNDTAGVIALGRDAGGEPFSEENLRVLASFTHRLSVAIDNARLYEGLEKTFLGTISALAAAVDAKDPFTLTHSSDVTAHAVSIASRMGLSSAAIDTIRLASMLHDIGKIAIDSSILYKTGPLTEEERAQINRHPTIGADMLAPLDFLKDVMPLILFHHERPDGAGYPSGISGSAIPLGARIIAVADSYTAMISDRPYREGLSPETARAELVNNAGTQFDHDVVDVFLELLAEES